MTAYIVRDSRGRKVLEDPWNAGRHDRPAGGWRTGRAACGAAGRTCCAGCATPMASPANGRMAAPEITRRRLGGQPAIGPASAHCFAGLPMRQGSRRLDRRAPRAHDRKDIPRRGRRTQAMQDDRGRKGGSGAPDPPDALHCAAVHGQSGRRQVHGQAGPGRRRPVRARGRPRHPPDEQHRRARAAGDRRAQEDARGHPGSRGRSGRAACSHASWHGSRRAMTAGRRLQSTSSAAGSPDRLPKRQGRCDQGARGPKICRT